jgi:hypothetical protein
MAQALAMAPSEALDVLYWKMRPVLYCSNLPAFVVVADSLLPTNIAK